MVLPLQIYQNPDGIRKESSLIDDFFWSKFSLYFSFFNLDMFVVTTRTDTRIQCFDLSVDQRIPILILIERINQRQLAKSKFQIKKMGI
jgi:hypothetical protein